MPYTYIFRFDQFVHIKNESLFKGGFFQQVRFVFQISKSPKKSIFKKTILNLKFKFPAKNTWLLLAGNLNFKLRIVFWSIFWGVFGDLKNKSHLLKKKHLKKTSHFWHGQSAICFSNLQISKKEHIQKNYPELEI